MMQVAIEVVILTDVCLTFFIIKIASLILRERAENSILSSLIGGELAIIMPKLFCDFFSRLLLIILSSLLIVFISFKIASISGFLRVFGIFIMSTFIFGGSMIFVQNLVGYYPVFIVSIIGTVVYVCSFLIIRAVQRKNRIENFCYKVKIKDNGVELDEDAFLDSGNMLYDSITKKPVILVSFDVFHKLYSGISLVSVLTKTIDGSSIKDGHYIKINSIGSGGSMFVFAVDELIVNDGKKFKDVMVGLSLSGFEKSFGKRVLLHSELV